MAPWILQAIINPYHSQYPPLCKYPPPSKVGRRKFLGKYPPLQKWGFENFWANTPPSTNNPLVWWNFFRFDVPSSHFFAGGFAPRPPKFVFVPYSLHNTSQNHFFVIICSLFVGYVFNSKKRQFIFENGKFE